MLGRILMRTRTQLRAELADDEKTTGRSQR
jgi:hypothetical protein